MRRFLTLLVGLAATMGASATVAAGRLSEPPAGAPAQPAFREPFHPIAARAARDPVPWRSPPLRHPIDSDIIDAMTALVASDSIDGTVVQLEGRYTREADLHGTWNVADHLAARFRSFGADSVFVHSWTHNFAPNVVAVHRGVTRPREIFLIGGHYDSISNVANAAPGADDNASGTAAVLECARVMCQFRFACTLQFAAWSAEEFGLLGSDAYVSHILARGDSLLGVINIDMIGYRAEGDRRDLDIISNPWSNWLRDAVMQAAAAHVPALPVVPGSYPASASSDQASFWTHGFSAISFFEDTESPSPYIHTANDHYLDSYNDPILARQSTQIAVATLAMLAEPVTVPVLVQDFEARPSAGQVELEWVLGGDAGAIASVSVERALEAAGPWTTRTPTPLDAEPRMRFVDAEPLEGSSWYRLALQWEGGVQYAGPLAIESESVPPRVALAARDPGPGQPVEIRYVIGRAAAGLQLGVFDVRGRRVRLLENGAHPAGTTLRYWDRRDAAGSRVTRGVYFVLLEAGATRVTRKLVLLHD